MKTTDLIVKHLNVLISKYKVEIDLLSDMKKKPTNELHQAEIDININYFVEEIKEIKNIVEILENEDLDKATSEKEKLILSSIENVGFSSNTLIKLKVCEVFTVLELISMSKEDLKRYRNLGKNSLKEIEEFMEKNNLSWNFKGL